MRVGVARGADPLTFMGLSGSGDLWLTATGELSRNRALGLALANGVSPQAYLAAQPTVAEGYVTARAAWRLALHLGVHAPVLERVYAVAYEQKPARAAIEELLAMPPGDDSPAEIRE